MEVDYNKYIQYGIIDNNELYNKSIEEQEQELMKIAQCIETNVQTVQKEPQSVFAIGDTHGDNLSLNASLKQTGLLTDDAFKLFSYYDLDNLKEIYYFDRDEAIKLQKSGRKIAVCFNPIINFSKYNKPLFLMGDYIDRGKESIQNLINIMQIKEFYQSPFAPAKDNICVIAGNHELFYNEILGNSNDMYVNKLLKYMYEKKMFTTGKIVNGVLFTHTPTSIEVCKKAIIKLREIVNENNIDILLQQANLDIKEFEEIKKFFFGQPCNYILVFKQAKILFGNLWIYNKSLHNNVEWKNLMLEMMFERETEINKHFLQNVVCGHSAKIPTVYNIEQELSKSLSEDKLYELPIYEIKDQIYDYQNNVLYTDNATSYGMNSNNHSHPVLFEIPIQNNKISLHNYKKISLELNNKNKFETKLSNNKDEILQILKQIIDKNHNKYRPYLQIAYSILLSHDFQLSAKGKRIKKQIYFDLVSGTIDKKKLNKLCIRINDFVKSNLKKTHYNRHRNYYNYARNKMLNNQINNKDNTLYKTYNNRYY